MSRDPLYLRCNCHTPYHFVLVEDDPDSPGYLNVSVVSTKSAGFWHRVKWALIHIFGREHLVEADLILDASTVAKLRNFLGAAA